MALRCSIPDPDRASIEASGRHPARVWLARRNWHHEAVADRASAAAGPVTIDDVRAWAMALPRTEEHLIRDYVKFRVGRIVYATVSPDETILGFGFPKEERAALIAAEPHRFLLERRGDARYNWIDARMEALSRAEAREFITDAWRMVVPKRVAAQVLMT
jgi:hypothetical protein